MSNPFDYGMGCFVDAVPTDCNRAMAQVNNGSAYVGSIVSRIGNGIVTHLGLTVEQHYVRIGRELQLARSVRFFRDLVPGSQPQDTDVVPLPNLRGGIQGLTHLGDCGQYIQSLIDKVAGNTGNAFVSDYIPDLFDAISAEGGVLFQAADPKDSEVGGTVRGTIWTPKNKNGGATIIITPQPGGGLLTKYLTPYGLKSTIYDYLIAAIHESIHLAGLNRRYTDRELAVAAHDLDPNSYLPADPRARNANSDAWNAELKKHCPGPKE